MTVHQRSDAWWAWLAVLGAIVGLVVGALFGDKVEPRVFDVRDASSSSPVSTEVAP